MITGTRPDPIPHLAREALSSVESVRYLRALRRSWWLIALAAVLGLGVGGLVFARTTPVYSTSTQMLATTSGVSAGGTDDGTGDDTGAGAAAATTTYVSDQARAFAQIAATPPAVADAASAAGFAGATPTVVASANGADPFLLIAVSDSDPAVARAVADAFPETLPATSARLSGALPVAVTLRVLSPAPLPASPTSPILTRYLLLALAVGLVGGVGLALGRGYLDRTIRDADELEAALDLPVLATVPAELSRERVPTDTHPRSARAEAYRQIRTSLASLTPDADGPPRTLLVTSAASGEGKTTTAVNLAVALRQAGMSVALVDADLRRPQVAASLGIETPTGLAHVLAGTATLAEAAHVDDAGAGSLTVLAAGSIPDNPSEALGSEAMRATLATLAADHDVVVVDSPPVIPVTDALVLAPHVDAVVLVVRLGLVRRDRIRRAHTVIQRVGGRIAGVVANGADLSRDRYYRYAYTYRGETPSMSVDLEAVLARRSAPSGVAHAGDASVVPRHGPARHAAAPDDIASSATAADRSALRPAAPVPAPGEVDAPSPAVGRPDRRRPSTRRAPIRPPGL